MKKFKKRSKIKNEKKLFANSQANSPVIEIQKLSKKFRKFTAVNNISFKVSKGHIHGFVGPNGAGKTTTIKSIVSAIKYSEGKILINGYKNTTKEAKKLIGYIPELARFPKKVSVFEYLVAMGRVGGLKSKVAKASAEKFLKAQNLWKFKHKDPNSFSSGMKKKVLLNQALLNDPQILILDEPAANLDPTARAELFNYLKELRKQGKTILISSHILAELQKIIDAVTILDQGKVIYSQEINQSEAINFKISTNDNDKLLKILKTQKITSHKFLHYLIVSLPTIEEIRKLQNVILQNDLVILSFDEEKIDLEEIYASLVMHKNIKEEF